MIHLSFFKTMWTDRRQAHTYTVLVFLLAICTSPLAALDYVIPNKIHTGVESEGGPHVNTLTANGSIVKPGADVIYGASQRISLKSGFRVKKGGKFSTHMFPTVFFTETSSDVQEDAGHAWLIVQLSQASGAETSVSYSVTGGTATTGDDFILDTGTLTFPAGRTYQAIHLAILDDSIIDPAETIQVTLSNPRGVGLGRNDTHTVILRDANLVPVYMAPNEITIHENSTGNYIRFGRLGEIISPLSIQVEWSGTAISNAHIVNPLPNIVTIPAGQEFIDAPIILNNNSSIGDDTYLDVSMILEGTNLEQDYRDFDGHISILDDEPARIVISSSAPLNWHEGRQGKVNIKLINEVGNPVLRNGTIPIVCNISGPEITDSDFIDISNDDENFGDYYIYRSELTRSFSVNYDDINEPNETFTLTATLQGNVAQVQGIIHEQNFIRIINPINNSLVTTNPARITIQGIAPEGDPFNQVKLNGNIIRSWDNLEDIGYDFQYKAEENVDNGHRIMTADAYTVSGLHFESSISFDVNAPQIVRAGIYNYDFVTAERLPENTISYAYNHYIPRGLTNPGYYSNDIAKLENRIVSINNYTGGPYQLGFTFPFYDITSSVVYICSNGWISLTDNSVQSDNTCLPSSRAPNNMIALNWDELDYTQSGSIYFKRLTNPTCAIIQYEHVKVKSKLGTPAEVNGQIILYPDGKITLIYREMPSIYNPYNSQSTTGLQADYTRGLQVQYNDAIFLHYTAIDFWRVSPLPRNPAIFNITRQGDVSEDLTVFYKLGGTAENGVDYQFLPQKATIPKGGNFTTVEIDAIEDFLYENNALPAYTESVTMSILPSPQYSHDIKELPLVYIFSSGDPAANFSASMVECLEKNSYATIMISLDRAVSQGVSVSYSTTDGSFSGQFTPISYAHSGIDYQDTHGTVSFLPNETHKTITIPISNNGTYEGDRIFHLKLEHQFGTALGSIRYCDVVIKDDEKPDAMIVINSPQDQSTIIGDTVSLNFSIISNGKTLRSVSVNGAILDGDVTASENMTATVTLPHMGNNIIRISALTMNGYSIEKTVTVTAISQTIPVIIIDPEPDESNIGLLRGTRYLRAYIETNGEIGLQATATVDGQSVPASWDGQYLDVYLGYASIGKHNIVISVSTPDGSRTGTTSMNVDYDPTGAPLSPGLNPIIIQRPLNGSTITVSGGK